MKRLISERFAMKGILVILSLLIAFHLLILCGVIPYNVVWGERLKDKSQMLTFEIPSVIVNLIILAVVMIKANIVRVRISGIVVRVALWVMVGLFMFNIAGNLLSNNVFEKAIFTPITLLLLIFSLRLAISE